MAWAWRAVPLLIAAFVSLTPTASVGNPESKLAAKISESKDKSCSMSGVRRVRASGPMSRIP